MMVKVAENGNASGEENQQTLSEKIMKKEKELELLITELDDKIRFDNRRGGDRPGSTGGQPFESFERPGSQSGHLDNGKNFESFEKCTPSNAKKKTPSESGKPSCEGGPKPMGSSCSCDIKKMTSIEIS